MLMTLLSVTAFAETDISSDPKVSMNTSNVIYGGSVAPAIQMLYDGYKMDGGDYTWDGKYYTTSACTAEAVDDDSDPYTIGTLPAGTYWVQVTGIGVYTGKRAASFEVAKREVTVDLIGGNLTKVYGAADPELTDADIDWTSAAGFVGLDDENVFDLTSLDYTYEGVNASATPYPVTVTGATAANYTLTINGGMLITRKPLVEGMITPVTLSEKYNGAVFTTFAVNVKDGSTPLVAGTDFTLKLYTEAAFTNVVAAPKNVRTTTDKKYYLAIEDKASANYSVADKFAAGTFEIQQAGLTVRALNQTKVYDGTNTLPSTAVNVGYQLIGVQGEDAFTGLTLTVGDAGNGKNFGDHTVTPSAIVPQPASNYTEATAKAYNAKLPGAVKAGDVQTPGTPAENYTEASANAYNATNVGGCVATGFVPSATSNPTLATIQAVVPSASDGVALTENEAYTYNCTIGGAKTTADEETAAVPEVLYTAETAAAYNAGLGGAVNTTMADPTTATLVSNYDLNYVDGSLNITQRGLTITALDAKKVYKKAETTVTKMDGTAKDADYGYGGVTLTPTLVEGEASWTIPTADIDAMKAEYKTTSDATKYNGSLRVERTGAGTDENKGDYEDALTIAKNNNGGVWANYDVTPVAGDFHIVGGKLYITALHQSKNYGEADPDWTAVEEKLGAVNPNYRVDGISTPDVVTGVTLSCTHEEAVGTYTINIDATGVPTGYEEIVFVPATFKINKRPIAVSANVQTLKLGDAPAALDQNAYTITTTAANEGLIDGDVASDVFSLTFDLTKVANPLAAVGRFAGAITKVDGTKAGNYEISFTKGELIVIDPASTIVLNRPNSAAYTADNTLDNAAEVIAAAAGQKYDAAGAAAANSLLTGAWPYGKVKTAATKYTKATANAYNATNVDGCVATGFEVGAATVPSLTDVNAVLATDMEAGAMTVDQAYEYNCSKLGHVTTDDDDPTTEVLYTDVEVNDHNATLPGAVAAGDVQKKCVTFGDFNMVAEKWYPVVLPFATSVREVSRLFGYAIVNILKKDNTNATKIAFKLHMGDIPANEPFVVKVYEDMNMNEVVFGDPAHLSDTGMSIVNSAAPQVEDDSHVKFIGSYSHKIGFAANEAFFSINAARNDYYWGSAGNTTYMAPLSAYFQLPEGSTARTIEFEEADGSTTAISVVGVEKLNTVKEGWYTLNGVKLQGIPTEKGVYIQNGKKIVIK